MEDPSRKRQCKIDEKHPATPFLRTQPLPSVVLQQKRAAQLLPLDRSITNLSTSSLFDTNKPRSSDGSSRAVGVGGVNNNGWDDENFDYIIIPGDVLDGRYRIKERIGKGSVGQVVRAEDIESSNQEVAIKIIKGKPAFLAQSQSEIELLEHLREKDPDDQHNIVRLLTHFTHHNHQCLVFEIMSMNLFQLLSHTQFRGVSLKLIREIVKHVLKALSFLARDDVDIIHCDLKPENILLQHPRKSGVKVIDFGSSCRSNQRIYPYIQSRFYRSPEVLLGLPYTAAIDMWSLGCILVEMHTGEPLFPGSDRSDQMRQIVKLLGMVPDCMLEMATDQAKMQFFQRNNGDGKWHLRQTKEAPPSSSSSAAAAVATSSFSTHPFIVPSPNPIASLTRVIMTPGLACLYPGDPSNSQHNYTLFIDLIYKMLAYDPHERIEPAEALSHPFLAVATVETSTAASTTTPSMASSALVASANPQKRKMDSLATVSNDKKQEAEDHQQEQEKPKPIAPGSEPSIFERFRRVFG